MTRRALALSAALALAACRGSVRTPVVGRHAGDAPIAVPTRPPPGKVEIILAPPPRLAAPVWIDGEWEWTGRRWQWKEARWEEPPAGCYYAPPTTVRRADGSLEHYKGAWIKGKPTK